MSRVTRSFSQSHNYGNNNNAHTSASANKSMSIVEPSLVVLQRDIDLYTRKLEFERKREYASQQQITDLRREMENRKNRIRQLKRITDDAKNRKASAQLLTLRRQSENNRKQYNTIINEINGVKLQINKLRRERTSFMEEFVQAEQQLMQLSKQTEEMNAANENLRDADVEKQLKMLDLQEKNHQDISNYEQQFNHMKDTFLRNKLVTDKDLVHSSNKNGEGDFYETLDTSTVLKNRLKKLIYKNKNKVKILDDYMRNLTIIDDGFNQIKEATGMTDIDEIKNTFIKSEEQNHQLLTYSDLLNQQNDTLEDVTKEIERKIAEQEKENQLRHDVLSSVPDEDKFKASIQAILAAKQVPIAQFQKQLDEILPYLEELLLSLAQSDFNVEMPYKIFEYQNGILLNDATIDIYLSDIDTYITELLKFVASKNDVPHALTGALMLEEIPEKQFKVYNPASDPQPNIPLNGVAEQEEPQGPNSIENTLYNYKTMRDWAVNILDKKKGSYSITNDFSSSPLKEPPSDSQRARTANPRALRGNLV